MQDLKTEETSESVVGGVFCVLPSPFYGRFLYCPSWLVWTNWHLTSDETPSDEDYHTDQTQRLDLSTGKALYSIHGIHHNSSIRNEKKYQFFARALLVNRWKYS